MARPRRDARESSVCRAPPYPGPRRIACATSLLMASINFLNVGATVRCRVITVAPTSGHHPNHVDETLPEMRLGLFLRGAAAPPLRRDMYGFLGKETSHGKSSVCDRPLFRLYTADPSTPDAPHATVSL